MFGDLEVAERCVECNRVADEDRVAAPCTPNGHLADAIEAVVYRIALVLWYLRGNGAPERRYGTTPFRAMAAFRGRVAEWA